jgi:hypothetical protein
MHQGAQTFILIERRSEQTANAMKNVAFQSGQRGFVPSMKSVPLRTDFSDYCSQKVRPIYKQRELDLCESLFQQVAILRAAAGIPSYLNDVSYLKSRSPRFLIARL